MKLYTEEQLMNEKDPFLREIWNLGYNEVCEDIPMQEIKFIRNYDGFIKRISRNVFTTTSFTIKESILYNGEIHRWLSEADGSAERFRRLINKNQQ